MVVIQIKNSEHDTFLYETSCHSTGDEVIREICKIWNLRIRLAQLTHSIRELAKYGPMKPTDQVGIDEIQEQLNGCKVVKNEFYQMDPTGIRTGNGIGPQLTETFEIVARDAESILDKNNVTRKIAITLSVLQEKLDNIRGAVTMAFPMQLPVWDTVRLTIEGNQGLEGTAAGQELLDENAAELWVASRCIDRSQTLKERFGSNEKTKVIAKLQRPGAGAPSREPVVNEEERKAMMAFYFKKQEELKQIAENSEDDYLNSSWADSKQLQRSLRGSNAVKAPGIR